MKANVKGKTEKKLGFLSLFFGVFLCLFQIFITFPIAVWKANKFNFEAPLIYSYSVIGLTLGIILLVSLLVSSFAPKKIRPSLSLGFALLAATIFIQQNFLNWNYGILDGQDLNFKQNFALGFIDVALWAAAISLLIFARPFVRRQIGNILTAVGSVAVIMAAMNMFSYGPVKPPYTITEQMKFEFSKSENIIIFLFDAYQMDLFLELIDTHPERALPLEGFTVYENSAAVFAKTYPTIPLFLTGKRYQKKEPLLDFFDTAYDNSLMEKMQKKGWDIGLYPNLLHFPSLINAVDLGPSIMDNTVDVVPSSAKIDSYLRALDLSLFRAVPHIIKPTLFNKGRFWINRKGTKSAYSSVIGQGDAIQPFKYKTKQRHEAVGFKDLLNEYGKAEIDDPAFRFYHFMIPHAPNWLDEDLNFVQHDPSFEAFREYSLAGLNLMGAYLNKLKDIGAYDNATIIIVSDHGMGTPNRQQYNPSAKAYETIEKYGMQRSAAKSILLIKNPGDRAPLKVSEKAVSGIDIAPTIAAAADINIGRVEGLDINAMPESTVRSRLFNYYEFSTWDSKYLDDFEAFEVNGHIRDEAAWERLGEVKAKIDLKSSNYYQIGDVISFGADIKNDTDHLNAFIESEDFIISPNYANAHKGNIALNIKMKKPVKADARLHLQFEIYSGAEIERKIIINGREKTVLIKPKRRVLNDGFIISPDIHKGQTSFNLSFAPVDTKVIKPLHLSSVKLSVYTPSKLSPKNLPEEF